MLVQSAERKRPNAFAPQIFFPPCRFKEPTTRLHAIIARLTRLALRFRQAFVAGQGIWRLRGWTERGRGRAVATQPLRAYGQGRKATCPISLHHMFNWFQRWRIKNLYYRSTVLLYIKRQLAAHFLFLFFLQIKVVNSREFCRCRLCRRNSVLHTLRFC